MCDLNTLDERENKWIVYYNSNNDGYNLDLGGKGIRGYKHSIDEIDKMRRIQNPLIVMQFDLNFNYVAEYIGGVSQIRKVLGYTKESIQRRCNHTVKSMSPFKDFYWVYKDEYISGNFSWISYLNNEKIVDVKKDNVELPKIIHQYDIYRNIVKTWTNISELKYEYNLNDVLLVCNHKRKIYAHYIWSFDGYDFLDGYFDDVSTVYYNKAIENKKRKVAKLDSETLQIIEIFSSIAEATRSIGFKSHANIIRAIKNNGTSGGYRWKYI